MYQHRLNTEVNENWLFWERCATNSDKENKLKKGETIEFFRPHYAPGVDSASNRNEYQESLKIKKPGGKVRPARRADNLAAIY
jgi:hypothetical protein